ncbi:hypothetical protein AB1207_11870 [Kineococcus endophyticus]|uniref:Uncharacterized protein n=1 Tax=Kineococcus endophyticus TaxID=1181883 RepID=A0ABV3P750_9ACTN
MSRTDRHRPQRVQVADPAEPHRVQGSADHVWLLHRACGHPGCSLRPESRRANRRERRAARQAARAVVEGLGDA